MSDTSRSVAILLSLALVVADVGFELVAGGGAVPTELLPVPPSSDVPVEADTSVEPATAAISRCKSLLIRRERML